MKGSKRAARPLTVIGWREWIGLPDFGIERVKAKVDTGAGTSSIHAIRIRPFADAGSPHVSFFIRPLQRTSKPSVECVAAVVDRRSVKSSSGHLEERFVVRTTATLGAVSWPIEITLTDRDAMGFRMLLGRQALRRRFLVDTGHSFVAGAIPANPDDPQA